MFVLILYFFDQVSTFQSCKDRAFRVSLFCCALLCVLSSFTIILKGKRELVALLLLSYGYLVTVNFLWLFFMVPWVGLLFVIVVFPDHTHLLFEPVLNRGSD